MTISGNEASVSSRRTVVALHGFLGLPSDWLQVFNQDFQSNVSVEAVDLWPTAKSLYSVDGFTSWSRQFLSHEFGSGEAKPVLLGYSMGGRLAMHAAIREPERWAGAVFVSAHPGLASDQEKQSRIQNDQLWAQRFREDPWESILEDWNAQVVLQPPREQALDVVPFQPRRESEFDREALACAMEFWSLGRQEDLRDQLHELSIPVLYITGELDAKFTKLVKELDLPSHHRHEVITGAGHRAPWDQPAQFRHILNTFLAKV